MVKPDAKIFIANPLITWSPLFVIQAKPCIKDALQEAKIAANNPKIGEPVKNVAVAATKADKSIFPSKPISMIPLLSEKIPAIAQNISGVEILIVESSKEIIGCKLSSIIIIPIIFYINILNQRIQHIG